MARKLLTVLLLAVAVLAVAPSLQASAQVRAPSLTALSWAEYHEAGEPYVWGGAGPWGYDCSGAVMVAYEHIGIWLPHYTVSMLYSGHLRWTRYPQPGDLVMWGGGYPYHVEMYVRPGWSFGAQNFGTVVGFHRLWGDYAFYHVV